MSELIDASFSPANLFPTILLLFVAGYWLIVLFGLISMESLDIDADVETDAGIDLEADADADVSADADSGGEASSTHSVSWFNQVLVFFNLHHLPLMVFLSFLALPMWVLSVLGNHYLGNTSFLLSLLLLVPIFLLSLFIAKFATIPVAKVFARLNENTEATDPIGKICTLLMPIEPGKMGQALIKDLNGNVVRINVVGSANTYLEKDESALVIQYLEKQRSFLIESYV